MKLSSVLFVPIFIALMFPRLSAADDPARVQDDVRHWRQANEQSIVDQFVELLRIPNVASDTVNIRRNADHLIELFQARGFETRLLESDGPPAVYGERLVEGAERTILIYIHYDGQPANAADWASDPWIPVMRTALVEDGGEEVPMTAPFDPEWRLFARSAGDDKAPVIALLSALDALMLDQLGIGAPEIDDRLEMAIMRPAINFRGIRSGDVGDAARNAIQVSATASVGLRLVPNQTQAHLRDVIEAHVRAQGYRIVYSTPDREMRREPGRIAELQWAEHGYPAYRASMDLPIAREVAGILDGLGDEAVIELPTMGGSLPIHLIAEELDAPVLILPIANHDNNQHGKDENLRL